MGGPYGFESWSLAQRVFRMKQARLCGRNGDTDDGCCFLHRMFLQLLKLDHLSNCRPQGADRATKNILLFLLHVTFLGVWSRIGISHDGACASESAEPSSEISCELRFFRRIIKAELIAIRVSHVEKADLPSNSPM